MHANDARSVVNIKACGGDGGAKRALECFGMASGIEEEQGAARCQEGPSFACPASQVREAKLGERFGRLVETNQGSIGIVGGFEESFEPATDPLKQVEFGVSRGTFGGGQGSQSQGRERAWVEEMSRGKRGQRSEGSVGFGMVSTGKQLA